MKSWIVILALIGASGSLAAHAQTLGAGLGDDAAAILRMIREQIFPNEERQVRILLDRLSRMNPADRGTVLEAYRKAREAAVRDLGPEVLSTDVIHFAEPAKLAARLTRPPGIEAARMEGPPSRGSMTPSLEAAIRSRLAPFDPTLQEVNQIFVPGSRMAQKVHALLLATDEALRPSVLALFRRAADEARLLKLHLDEAKDPAEMVRHVRSIMSEYSHAFRYARKVAELSSPTGRQLRPPVGNRTQPPKLFSDSHQGLRLTQEISPEAQEISWLTELVHTSNFAQRADLYPRLAEKMVADIRQTHLARLRQLGRHFEAGWLTRVRRDVQAYLDDLRPVIAALEDNQFRGMEIDPMPAMTLALQGIEARYAQRVRELQP